MVASALQEVAEAYVESGRPLPLLNPEASATEADLVELLPLVIETGVPHR